MSCWVQAEEAKELEELEAQLPVNDILLYRLLAEHRLQQKEALPTADAEAVQPSSEAARSVEDFSVRLLALNSACMWQDVLECLSCKRCCLHCRQQSWLGWGVSSIAGYLGYVPSQNTPQELSPPSESDIQELFHDLGFDPQMQVDSRDVAGAVGINVRVRVSCFLELSNLFCNGTKHAVKQMIHGSVNQDAPE